MPYYKDAFSDSMPEPALDRDMKSIFDDTYPGDDKKDITFKFEGITRAPTDIEGLFNSEAVSKLKRAHPNLYGLLGTGIETAREIGDWTVDMIPALKYARPDDRELFNSMSQTDQSIAILTETAGALLWAVAFRPGEALRLIPRAGRGLYGATKATVGALKTGYKPVLDHGFKGWKAINERKVFMDWAKKRGVPKPRAEQAFVFGSGETTTVREGSRQLWEIYTLEQEVARQTLKSFGATASKSNMKEAFQGWASKRFKRTDKNMSMDTASEPVMSEFSRWYAAAEPAIHKTARTAAQTSAAIGKDLYGFVNLYPIRFVLGAGEKAWQTFSRVYRPIETATKFKNTHLQKNILRFYEILEESKLGTLKGKKFRPVPEFSRSIKEQGYKFVTGADDIHEAVRQGTMTTEQGAAAINGLINTKAPEFPIVRRLIDAYYEYADHLYAQHTKWKMEQIFSEAGLTQAGMDRISLTIKDNVIPIMEDLFAATNGRNPTDKVAGLQELLHHLKVEAQMPGMFKSPLAKEAALANLEYGAEGGIMEYLGGYATRIIQRDFQAQDISFKLMASDRVPWYTQPRTATQAVGRAADFDSMIYLRTNAQAKEMFYNSALTEVAGFVQNLPDDYKTYISHWVARLHGIPSQLDHNLARVMNNVVPGTWDARRIFNLTKTVNDFTYMGILGFKPFSAMRNLFQPAITLTPTLGQGFVKGWEMMLKGYGQLRNPEMISYLNSIGVITDYAPELMKMTNVFKIPRAISIGDKSFAIPTRDAVRDVAMWMFSGSDRLNRYVSGAAAVLKWDEGIALFEAGLKAGERVKAVTNAKDMRTIMNATGADKRPAWIQTEIRDLLHRGKIPEAKKSFVTDIVAGSQWLYGPLDAPIVTQTFGSLGRQMAVFQSWWVHYGANLEQWARTGRGPGGSAERMLSWAMSSAVVATAMTPVWGKGTAVRSTFFGPFHGVASRAGDPYKLVLMVPAWRPVIESAELAVRAGQLITGPTKAKTQKVKSRMKALVKTSFNFVPGGNVFFQVQSKAFMKKYPGIIPTGWELKSAVKEGLGIRSY